MNTTQPSFLAAIAPHSGDWLLALPITTCSLLLDHEAVRSAVALRLSLILYVPYACQCDAQIDAFGIHCLICNHASGRITRRLAISGHSTEREIV
jgi:hypothetical protein